MTGNTSGWSRVKKGGDIEKRIRDLLANHPSMPKTEMAEILGVSRKTLYKHLGRIEKNGNASPPALSSAKTTKTANRGKGPKKEQSPKDGPKKNRPPPGPHSTGFKPGNTLAVTTGERINPFLLALLPAKDAAVIADTAPKNEREALERSVSLYDARIRMQLVRLAKLEAQHKSMVTFESSYTRQEGDGEIMGTGRISTRKRRSLDEEIRRQHQIIDKTQRLYDAAVRALHDMSKNEPPGGPNMDAYFDALKKTAEEVWGDDGEEEPEGADGK